MLRITAKREGKKTKVLHLEGKISKDWVKPLQEEIKRGLNEAEKVILDFMKVHYLDEEAARMLGRLPHQKVEKRNCSLFIQEMLRRRDR